MELYLQPVAGLEDGVEDMFLVLHICSSLCPITLEEPTRRKRIISLCGDNSEMTADCASLIGPLGQVGRVGTMSFFF